MTTKTALPTPRFVRVPGAAALLALLLVALLPGAVAAAPGDPCAAPVDVIACENTKPGTPQAVWDVTGDGNQTIQGYATQMSVDRGEPVHFKVKTDANDYRIELYRIGYYGGDGARLVDTIQPSASLPQSQPACLTDAATGLIDCGNWGVSATWNPPADAVSGVYAARLVRTDTGGESHMLFVMRDDERRSDVVVKTADETWAAYNNYGGVSLYGHGSGGVSWWSGRGYKVSYNRPLKMRESERFSSFFSAEYPLVRWMERNGYDVSYIAGIDAARRPAELLEHKLLVSSGHDEYWSHEQRANVEAARDAGVNLAFFSGNEIFWKTRWEPSIDGTATADRTLVSYKESNATTKIDPSPLWTGTWRDGRFSPPSDGGRPENALTGTLYMVNAFRNDPIEIPARFGKARLWRNTGIDTLAPGETASLPAGLLGYEWDVDADNGHRPPGLIRLSETTRDLPRELLLNHGTVYGAGRATHSLNLYRAASGALVFGAGTVQWAWGLDGRHDNDGPDQDRRTQQATVNLLADMTVQPRSLQSNLTPATASTDGTAPTVEITGPAAGTRFSRSDVVTITGTAQDAGGVVGGVEVSVDGGETWHYAKGHEQWEYRWNVTGFGAVDVRARAADDSGNIGQADQRTLEVGCPCSLWSNAISPGVTSFADVMSYELGVKFRSDVPGYVTGVRFYKGTANTGVHLGHLWDSLGNRLGEVRFEDETATGWQTASFAKPIPVLPGMTYIASYYAPKGGYALDRPFFTQPVLAPPLRALADGEDGPNAVFKSGVSGFPTQTKQASNYWVDVVFDQDGTDRVGPGLLSTRPAASAESAPISADITAQFDEELDPASVNGGTFELRTAAGAPVAASVRYDAGTRSAVLDPAASLDLMTTYRATLRGGEGGLRDPGGNVLKGDREWTFTTFGCPCSLWSDAALPNITSHWDTQAYELGLKFRSEVNGYVTGIRFYKGSGNTGTHLGHLWTAAGVRLGEVRFENETATGWQTAKFSTPIAVSAGATYIASYFAPNGRYALDRPGFTTDRTRGPLRALADGEEGGNAVFRTGSSGFPTQSKDASNYWVDLVFHQDGTDRMAPRVLSTTPTAGSTSAALSRDIVVRFDEPIDHTTVTGSNLELTTADGAAVGASVRYDAATQTATIDPVALLSAGTSYRVVVRGGAGGVRDLAGNPLDGDHAWTFSTFTCPCSLWTSFTLPATAAYPDSQAYELGVKFRAEIDGLITGVRFYKGAGNTGTHLGHLWTAGGAQLGEVTFTNETATGWQTASFATPIPISAGTTYIASYHAPRGNYALNRPYFTGSVSSGPLTAPADGESGGNAVFKSGVPGFPNKSKEASNYWVDPVFVPAGG